MRFQATSHKQQYMADIAEFSPPISEPLREATDRSQLATYVCAASQYVLLYLEKWLNFDLIGKHRLFPLRGKFCFS